MGTIETSIKDGFEKQTKLLQRLTKVVIEGNGNPSLMTRMALMEKSIESSLSALPKQQSTIRKDNYTEINSKWFGIKTNSASVQNGIRLIMILLGVAALLYVSNKLEDINKSRQTLMSELEKVKAEIKNDTKTTD